MRTSFLSFRWRDRDVGPYQTPRRFLDFEVDGVSLYDAIGHDLISWLGNYTGEYEHGAIQRLLLQEQPDPWVGYPELYVCPECADLGCGAITVRVVRSDGLFTWRELYYDPDPFKWMDGEHFKKQTLDGLGPYHFPEGAYAEALAYAVALTKSGVLRVNPSDSGPA